MTPKQIRRAFLSGKAMKRALAMADLIETVFQGDDGSDAKIKAGYALLRLYAEVRVERSVMLRRAEEKLLLKMPEHLRAYVKIKIDGSEPPEDRLLFQAIGKAFTPPGWHEKLTLRAEAEAERLRAQLTLMEEIPLELRPNVEIQIPRSGNAP